MAGSERPTEHRYASIGAHARGAVIPERLEPHPPFARYRLLVEICLSTGRAISKPLVAKDGTVVFNRAYGLAKVECRSSISLRTIPHRVGVQAGVPRTPR